jgi:hypothetical protein
LVSSPAHSSCPSRTLPAAPITLPVLPIAVARSIDARARRGICSRWRVGNVSHELRFDAGMLFPLIGPRLHGWLDDLVALIYIAGALGLGLRGVALAIAIGGALVHFALTRLTDYPQGTFKLIPFRAHAFIELGEGLAVLAASLAFAADRPLGQRLFLGAMGAAQLGAFALSDYDWPSTRPPAAGRA